MSERESMDQANSFQRVIVLSTRAGLCHTCAAQLGWAAQLGFRAVHPPCAVCAPLVGTWPSSRPNGWRVPVGRLSSATTWAGQRPSQTLAAVQGASS